jgi:hypothetical protein
VLQLPERAPILARREVAREACDLGAADPRRRAGKHLRHQDARACTGSRLDLEAIHQGARAGDADAHPGLRSILPCKDGLEIRDAGALVDDVDAQGLRTVLLVLDDEGNRPAAPVCQGIARDLGHGRGDTSGVAGGEAEELGDLPCTLAGEQEIVLAPERYRDERNPHGYADAGGAGLRITRTVASSRARAKSRKSTPASSAG